MTIEVTIPHHYIWMSQSSKKPREKFKRYVTAYVKQNYPGYRLVKINQMKALIQREKSV